jgi:hypothetical protein
MLRLSCKLSQEVKIVTSVREVIRLNFGKEADNNAEGFFFTQILFQAEAVRLPFTSFQIYLLPVVLPSGVTYL